MSEPGKSCALCGRIVPQLTRHHLIPRTRHRNKRNKRDFARSEVKSRVVMICRACHNQVHALFTEKTLEREFNTLETLANHPEIIRFVNWVKTKPPTFRPGNHSALKKK